MKTMKINEKKRVSYEVSVDYNTDYLLEDILHFSENKMYFKRNSFLNNDIGALAKDLAENMKLKDLVGCGFDDEIVDLLYYSSDIEYFASEEYQKDIELLSSSAILNKDIEELEECLNTWAAYELWGYKDYITELIENGKINDILINKEVIKNEWRGYSQGDWDDIYTLIEFKNEEERKAKKAIAEEDFKYLSNILRGDVYSFIVAEEELVYYKELNGNKTLNNWEEVRSDSIGGIVAEYEDLESEFRLFLQDFLSEEDFNKVLTQDISFDVSY